MIAYKVREEVRWFAGRMEEVLVSNDYKGGWDSCPLSYLLGRLRTEITELEEALVDGGTESTIQECCDVANYAMMIADRMRRGGQQ